MGTSTDSGLSAALLSPVQGRVLGLLFGQPDRRFRSAELIQLADSGTGAVHRVLKRLAAAGLIDETRVGNQVHYQANRRSPVYEELHGLVIKTVALAEPLTRALEPMADRIRAAFVYGSVARGSDTATSDIDLTVVSDSVGYPEVFEAVQAVEAALARSVNPTVLTESEWRERAADADSFVARLAEGPRLFILGRADELA